MRVIKYAPMAGNSKSLIGHLAVASGEALDCNVDISLNGVYFATVQQSRHTLIQRTTCTTQAIGAHISAVATNQVEI